MKKGIKIFIYGFVFITGLIAGIGLLLMDSTLQVLVNPVMIEEAPHVPEELNATSMKIRIKDDIYIRGLYMNNPDSEFVVLFCHDGNGNIYHRYRMFEEFQKLGVSVFAIDFRGFGLSDSVEMSDEAFHKDLSKMYSALRRQKWSSSRIIIYGQGIFAGIQGDLLEKNQCAAWVLDNPIPSLKDSASNPIRQLLTVDRLSVYSAIKKVQGSIVLCCDPEIIGHDTVAKLTGLIPDIMLCEIAGNRTRDKLEDSDWDSWRECMTNMLGSIHKPDKPSTHIQLGKHRNKDRK